MFLTTQYDLYSKSIQLINVRMRVKCVQLEIVKQT